MIPNLCIAERGLIDQVDCTDSSTLARDYVHDNVHLLGLGMRHQMVREFCLIQAFVFQGALQTVQGSGHIGLAEGLAESQAHRRNRHSIARRLVKSVNPDSVNEEVPPHHKIHLQTFGAVRNLGHNISISPCTVKLAQAFALNVQRKRLIYAKRKTAGVFVKDLAGLIHNSNGNHPSAVELRRWRWRRLCLGHGTGHAAQPDAGQREKNRPRTIRNHSPL